MPAADERRVSEHLEDGGTQGSGRGAEEGRLLLPRFGQRAARRRSGEVVAEKVDRMGVGVQVEEAEPVEVGVEEGFDVRVGQCSGQGRLQSAEEEDEQPGIASRRGGYAVVVAPIHARNGLIAGKGAKVDPRHIRDHLLQVADQGRGRERGHHGSGGRGGQEGFERPRPVRPRPVRPLRHGLSGTARRAYPTRAAVF